ncbi:MAG TPA: CPBP family intramembrane glutamic endopeptidase, partial [Acidobacteriota bacterium]|nr:CPBP family intramembrane glutamic endopeptidase [Acidobacteriota bacterium]
WRWKVRFFRPPEREELIVWLDPAGNLVGFEHVIEEQAPGARLQKLQAQNIAELFLHNHLGLNLDDYALVEDSVQERPKRLDYLFTWERKQFRAKHATYRISASTYGDQIGRALPFLKVPEQWQRDYQRLRSRNQTFQTVANLLTIPLFIGVLFVLIPRIRERQILWKPLLWLSAVVGLVVAAAGINSLPQLYDFFPTSVPYSNFVVGWTIIYLIQGVVFTLLVVVLLAGGDVLYRETAREKVAVPRLFSLSGLQTKEFLFSTLIGYCLAAIQFGFVVVFYLVARRFGAWSPAEVKYGDFLSTALPWIYPLTVGLQAATTEEFTFRLFAIPFVKKYTKSTLLAVALPAFIWGFGHSNYPQQPAWIRGVEVGLVGVILGFVMLRFGILATLVAHYTYNAATISLLLFRSKNLYFMIAGGLVVDAVLIPLTIAAALYWQHRRFASDPQLFNATLRVAPPVPAAERAEEAPAATRPAALKEALYVPLSKTKLALAAVAGLLGLAVWWLVRVEGPLDFLRWQTTPRRAEEVADAFLRSQSVNPAQWRHATSFDRQFQVNQAEYVRRLAGIKKVNEVWSTQLISSSAAWRIRYFRPLQKEEHQVFVGSDGRIVNYDHLLEEKAPGTGLTEAEAERRAEDYVGKMFHLNVADWKLAESKTEKRDARTDHRLVWEDRRPVTGEAYLRATATVAGDEVAARSIPATSGATSSSLSDRTGLYLKVPEEWLRELIKPRISDPIASAITVLLMVVVIVLGAQRLPQHSFKWRLYIGLASLVAGVNLFTHLNRLRTWGQSYDTSVGWQTYLFQQISQIVLATMGITLLALLLALAVDVFYSARELSFAIQPRKGGDRISYFRDAAIAAVSAVLFLQGLAAVFNYLEQRFPIAHRSVNPAFGSALDAYLPGLTAGIDSVLRALFWLSLMAILLGVLRAYVHARVLQVILVILLVTMPSIIGTIGAADFLRHWGFALVVAGAFVLVMVHFFDANLLSYLVAFTLFFLSSDVQYYLRQPSNLFRLNALVAIAVAGAFLYGVMVSLRAAQ